MPCILYIETATNTCSIALAANRQLLAMKESNVRNTHAATITRFIDEVAKSSKTLLSEIDAVAVSKGPGSYTGLRIGVATAKGLCYALDKPLIAVPTLQAMAAGIPACPAGRRLLVICPMIDARRMEVYYALYDIDGNEIRETRAEVIGENSFSDILKDHTIIFGGDGSMKCRDLLKHQRNAFFLDDFNASAKDMISIAEDKYGRKEFEDLAYFEPFYLKDFIAGKPAVKGLY